MQLRARCPLVDRKEARRPSAGDFTAARRPVRSRIREVGAGTAARVKGLGSDEGGRRGQGPSA